MALAASPSFRTLSEADQRVVYRDLVNSEYEKLAEQSGLAGAMRGRRDNEKASDNIDDERHDEMLDMSDGAQTFGEYVDTVDFPSFVKDLLQSVYQANMQVIKDQNEEFMELMKAATTDLSKFIKAVDDTTAMGYLADNNSDSFSLDFEDDKENPGGEQKPVLKNKRGEAVDIGDNQVKAKIMEAKIEMAKQHQASLKQMVAMGATRIVVNDGKVRAAVMFDFSSKRTVNKADKAMNKNSKSTGASRRRGGIASWFGAPSYGRSRSERSTNLSVSSAKSSATDEMKAKLTGEVEINFKTDYAPLGDFVNKMYETEQKAIEANAGNSDKPKA